MRNPYIKIQDDISNMNTYVRTYVRTSRNQYVPYFFKVGGITKDVAQYGAKHGEQYPTIAKAARRLLVSPVSTVDCERGFSKQNLFKTAIRNRINIDNLENLMMISIEGPDRKKFDFTRAFNKWASKCERKILQ